MVSTMRPKDEGELVAVVSAACSLVAERGLVGLTLTDIAEAAFSSC
jgi:hypothetical protein